jgi:hypothetical protein
MNPSPETPVTSASRSRIVALPFIVGMLALAGCAGVGPGTVSRDRFDYNGEVARSWKEQTLLNIVKTRYADMPVFLDVSQIVSGYTLESSVSLGATEGRTVPPGSSVTLGAQGKWTDRPTITYTPLTGAQFNRSMLTPISPAAVLFTMQSGWPIELVFGTVVSGINGIGSVGPTAPRFQRLVGLMGELQRSRTLGMRLQSEKGAQETVVLFFRSGAFTPEEEAMVTEVRDMLGLAPGQREFRVAFGAVRADDGEIALLTRSMMQVLVDLGDYVEVPEADLREGRAMPSRVPAAAGGGSQLRIRFSAERPADALVAVRLRNGWFWVDDRDIHSKRAFAMVLIFSTLVETGARESLPLVTIPAG